MSKHSQRRERREQYYWMLDEQIACERRFVARVIRAMDRGGSDAAQDGRPIRADFWRYASSRVEKAPHTALACLDLVERPVASVQPSPHLRQKAKD